MATQSANQLSVLIPVYNEEATVAELLDRVRAVDLSALGLTVQAVIVDDGSTDRSAAVIRSYLRAHTDFDAHLVSVPINGGKGRAIQRALEVATGRYTIIQDADLEYDPRDWPALLAPLVRGDAPAVFGSRLLPLGPDQRRRRIYRIGLTIARAVTLVLYGRLFGDMATCYKAFRTDLLRALRLERPRFDFDPEVAVRLVNRGVPVIEVPISYRPRFKEQGKKIRWHDFFSSMYVLIRYRFYDPGRRDFHWPA